MVSCRRRRASHLFRPLRELRTARDTGRRCPGRLGLTVLAAIALVLSPLTKVTDMSFRRSSLGRVLGYGEFVLESAGQDQALRVVDHLPCPEQLYLEVCGRNASISI